MSTAAVQDFLNKVGEDGALQAELAQAMEAENDRAAVTELAKSKGYDFTADELSAEIEQRQQEVATRQEAGQLSDEELEAVAGGGIISPFITLPGPSIPGFPGTPIPSFPQPKW